MKMPILNIIISFCLMFQFSLGNLDILYDLSNNPKANELYSAEECGEEGDGCFIIKILFFYKHCHCPLKRENKHI